MRVFAALYDRALSWAAHRHASWYLAFLSFIESSFFPIPPDVMLAPMALARRDRAWFYAGLTTVASVAGGIAGYAIGWFAFEAVEPLLHRFGYWDTYQMVRVWFDQWGVWVVFVAGFSPIPYKVFTIASGAMGMAFVPFVLASAVGRGGRFFLVAWFVRTFGERVDKVLRRYMDAIGWTVVVMVVLAIIVYKIR